MALDPSSKGRLMRGGTLARILLLLAAGLVAVARMGLSIEADALTAVAVGVSATAAVLAWERRVDAGRDAARRP